MEGLPKGLLPIHLSPVPWPFLNGRTGSLSVSGRPLTVRSFLPPVQSCRPWAATSIWRRVQRRIAHPARSFLLGLEPPTGFPLFRNFSSFSPGLPSGDFLSLRKNSSPLPPWILFGKPSFPPGHAFHSMSSFPLKFLLRPLALRSPSGRERPAPFLLREQRRLP